MGNSGGLPETHREEPLGGTPEQGSPTFRTSNISNMDNKDYASRYNQRGVSSSKEEVHRVVDKLDRGCFPGAFCKITEDYLTGNQEKCNVIHSDGAIGVEDCWVRTSEGLSCLSSGDDFPMYTQW